MAGDREEMMPIENCTFTSTAQADMDDKLRNRGLATPEERAISTTDLWLFETPATTMNLRASIEQQIKEADQAARQDEREQCRIVALIHSQYPITTDYDRGYDQARKDAAESIKRRALAEEVT